MTQKPGRNDPCPCGSGKKYKKCHGGSVPLQRTHRIPFSTVTAQVPAMGLPGEAQGMVMCNVFGGMDPRNIGGPPGLPGQYKVSFLFERPGYRTTPEKSFSFISPLKGDSHLAITPPAFVSPANRDADQIRISARTPHGAFEFNGFPNEKGFLGKIVSEPFYANNRSDAQQRANDALVPSLSNWSIHLDIPLQIQAIETIELRTENYGLTIVQPYLEAPFAVESTPPPFDSEFAHYAGMYREALNCNSPIYRFLCLFKIIEGIRVRRARLGKEAGGARDKCVRPLEVIPNDDASAKTWLNALFPIRHEWDEFSLNQIFIAEAKGKRLMHLVVTELTNLRDRIAHSIMRSGELSLSTDDLINSERVNRWLPLTRCIARRMLKNDFPTQFLSYIKDAGGDGRSAGTAA